MDDIKQLIAAMAAETLPLSIPPTELAEILNRLADYLDDSLSENYKFGGVISSDSKPSSSNSPAFYIAGAGTYVNFGNAVVPKGCMGIFMFKSDKWSFYNLDLASSLGSKDDLPSSDATAWAQINLFRGKNITFEKGFYFDQNGNLTKYSSSKLSELINIPTKDCTFKGLWNVSIGFGIVFVDELGKYISGLDVGTSGTNQSYSWVVSQVTVPENAKYIVLQSQKDYVSIETTEQLGTGIPYLFYKDTIAAFLANKISFDDVTTRLAAFGSQEYSEQVLEEGISGKYIDKNGSINTWSPYSISTAIPLKAGEYIRATCEANIGISMLSLCDESLTKFTALVEGQGGSSEAAYFAEEDCFVCLCYNNSKDKSLIVGSNDLLKLVVGLQKETSKIPDLQSQINTKATLKKVIGKNLFDKTKVIDGYYIGTSNGVLLSNSQTSVSPLIPIEEGEVYLLKRGVSLPSSVREVRFVAEDGTTQILPLTEDGTPYTEYRDIPPKIPIVVKAPVGAKYFQFTCKFANQTCDYDNTQFEKGNTFTGYEPYKEKNIVDYENLPSDLEGLSKRVDDLEKTSSKEIINIANSDKIGFFSNSFLNGYCMLGKHAINNLSMYSDYIMYNFGHSGDDMLECLNRIDKNESWLGDVAVKDWGITYGVIAMQDNDGALFNASSDTYYYNTKHLAEAIKTLGAVPIVGTEHDVTKYYYALTRLCQEQGYMFIPWGKKASRLCAGYGLFKPFWWNSHPSTRTAWLWTYGMKPYLDTLPRPNKSIKIFRKRANVSSDNLQNLVYNDFESRAEKFEELTCGVQSFKTDYNKYFDRLDNVTLSEMSQQYKDEYQALQAKSSTVNLGDCALVEVITPYDVKGISSLVAHINATGISNIYIKKTLSLTNPLPANQGMVAFGVASGIENVEIGTSFNVTGGQIQNPTDIQGSYTVSAIVGNVIVTTTPSSGKETSGTDMPECDLVGVTLSGSYSYPSGDYLNRYNKPYGEWEEIAFSENILLDEYLSNCMDFDKVSLLLVGSDINLYDINFDVVGNRKKNVVCMPLISNVKGEEYLTKTTFNDEDTEWIGLDSLSTYAPVESTNDSSTENLPTGITMVKVINQGQEIKQALKSTIASDEYISPKVQVKVVARYFPKYIDSDDAWITTELNVGTYDCAKLQVLVAASEDDINPVCIGEIAVGAWWNEFLIDTYCQGGTHLILKCTEKKVQLASCSLQMS